MIAPEHQSASLHRILDIARHLAATTDLDELLRMIVDATCQVLGCERASIFLYDPQTHELWTRVATGDASIRMPADRGIAGAAAKDRVLVNVPDAYADPRFNPAADKQTGFRTCNLLAFPLENLDGELMGVLQALNKSGGCFCESDEDLAQVLAAQAGMALHRQRLLEEHAVKQRLARDLDIARGIQLALFPKHNPVIAGYEIAGWNRSADETGGDCYDFHRLADGRLAVLLADATGHGIGAALVMAQFRSLLRAMLSVTPDLPRIADAVNRLLLEDLAEGRFVTAFIGLLDPVRHEIEYVSGGQGPLVFVSDTALESRPANALPFAVASDLEFSVSRFALPPGATLALLTDGFYETANGEMELFGEERVVSFIRRHATTPLGDLITGLHGEVQEFSAGQPQADDLTAVFIRRTT